MFSQEGMIAFTLPKSFYTNRQILLLKKVFKQFVLQIPHARISTKIIYYSRSAFFRDFKFPIFFFRHTLRNF